jgi:hypothetical protein
MGSPSNTGARLEARLLELDQSGLGITADSALKRAAVVTAEAVGSIRASIVGAPHLVQDGR